MNFKLINPALHQRVLDFLRNVGEKDRLAILHHTDPDGICSAALLARFFEMKMDGFDIFFINQKPNEILITDATIVALREHKVNKLIVVDMAVDQVPQKIIEAEKFLSVLVIDHHKLYTDSNSPMCVVCKPQMIYEIGEDAAWYCSSKFTYDLITEITPIEELAWISAIGIIGDCATEQWKPFMQRLFLHLRITLKPDMFSTDLGQIADMISCTESYDWRKARICLDLLRRAKGYKELFTSEIAEFQSIIKKEVEYWISNAEKLAQFYDDIDLIFYYITPQYSVKSTMSTLFAAKYPNKTIIIIQDTKEEILPFSARRQDKKIAVNELVEEAVRNFAGAQAGGHIPSAGGTIHREDLERFRNNIVSILSRKKDQRGSFHSPLLSVWKKVEDDISAITGSPVKTISMDGEEISATERPYFCQLVHSRTLLYCKAAYKEKVKLEEPGFVRPFCQGRVFIVPIVYQEKKMGVLSIGPLRNPAEAKSCESAAKKLGIDESELADAYLQLKSIENIEKMQVMLHFAASTAFRLAYEACADKMRVADYEILQKISGLLNSSLALEKVLDQIINFLMSTPQVQCSSLLLFENKKRYITTRAPLGEQYKEFENIVAEEVTKTHSPVLVHFIPGDPRFRSSAGNNLYTSLACFPLRYTDKFLGVMTIYSQSLDWITLRKDLLTSIASQTALAIWTAKQFEYIQELAVTDKLTGLFNRRKFLDILEQEIGRVRRFGKPISVAMIDVDHFRNYNNSNGHLEGDRLLSRLGEIFLSTVREIDTVGRYGGEEFIMIFPETTTVEVLDIAKRIMSMLSREHFLGEEKQPLGKISISMGLLTCLDGSLDSLEMIREADKALYSAKNKGRDTIVSSVAVNRNMKPMEI